MLYWEQQFSLLKPLKRSGGRRYYRPDDVAMVETINRLVNEEGYTLKGAEAVLRSSNSAGADRRRLDRRIGDRRAGDTAAEAPSAEHAPPQMPSPALAESIAKLKSIRSRLAKAIEV